MINLSPKVGDLVVCRGLTSLAQTGMIIAARPSNDTRNYRQNHDQHCYHNVYYVLSHEGVIEGPLFLSEIMAISSLVNF